jgi:hypothetical protein
MSKTSTKFYCLYLKGVCMVVESNTTHALVLGTFRKPYCVGDKISYLSAKYSNRVRIIFSDIFLAQSSMLMGRLESELLESFLGFKNEKLLSFVSSSDHHHPEVKNVEEQFFLNQCLSPYYSRGNTCSTFSRNVTDD